MATSNLTRAVGLILLGFLGGIIFSQLSQASSKATNPNSSAGAKLDSSGISKYHGKNENYSALCATQAWDVLMVNDSDGRHLALGQGGLIRVRIIDDVSSLYVMTYNNEGPAWQGRLMDVGNDGTVEVADISGGRCENFANH